MKEKKIDPRPFDQVSYWILTKKIYIYKHLQRKLTNGLFWLQYDVANFIFSLKYCQWKVDLNAGEKSLVFVTKRHRKFHHHSYRIRKFHIYAKIRIYGKMLLSYIFVWSKAQKIWYFRDRNIREQIKTWSFLQFSQIFVRRKFFFSSCAAEPSLFCCCSKIWNGLDPDL